MVRLPARFPRGLALLAVLAIATPLERTVSPARADDSGSAAATTLPPWTPDANAPRSAVPSAYYWDLSPLFPSDEAWNATLDETRAALPQLAAFKGTLSDPKQLLACLETYFRLHDRANHVTLYANLKLTTAQTDAGIQAMSQRALALMDELMREAGFIRAEVLAIPDKTLQKAWKKVPELLPYRTYVENLRRRRTRVLGEEAERVLSLAGDNLWAEIDLNEIPSPSEDVFNALLTDIAWPVIHDASGQEVQLTLSNYGRYRRDADRRVRQEAVEAFFGTLRQYQHALAAALAGQARFDVTLARARGYDTAMEAYLDKDGLDVAVYENLVQTVNANLAPLHRYVALRKQILGLDEVHIYDLYNPILPSVEVEVPFDEARKTILEALAPLGEAYVTVLEQGMDPGQGWLDLYPSADKDSGAFSAAAYGPHPYVMMNYQDSLDDMSTLAHEYGHAMHTWLSMEAQAYPDFRYVPFLAEIASTANEVLLSEHLLGKATDPRVRAMLLTERLDTIRGTIYRQAMFAEFEWKLHQFVEQGTPVTATLLEQTYRDLVAAYYGPAFAIGPDDGMEWAYIPHFYWKYYVFNYATGLSSGIAIAERILNEGPEARDAYLEMLRAGCSAPPLEILKGAGVDLTRPEAIEAALKLFDETLTELEALLPQVLESPETATAPEPPAAKPARR